MIEEMDNILTTTGIEHQMIAQYLKSSERPRSGECSGRRYKELRLALRYSILLGITGLSYRELSQRVADSSIFQWFIHTAAVDGVRPVSKSSVEKINKADSDASPNRLCCVLSISRTTAI